MYRNSIRGMARPARQVTAGFGQSRALSPVCFVCVPVGASHAHPAFSQGLEWLVPSSVVNWRLGQRGWSFEPGPGVVPDPVHHAHFLSDVYRGGRSRIRRARDGTSALGQETRRIVSNESAEIIRMFNRRFDGVGAQPGDYYPAAASRGDR